MKYFAKLPRHRDEGGLFAFDKYEGAGAKCYVTANYASFVDHLGRLPFTGSVPPMKDEVRGLGHCFFGEPCAYELMRPGCRTKLFLDLEIMNSNYPQCRACWPPAARQSSRGSLAVEKTHIYL